MLHVSQQPPADSKTIDISKAKRANVVTAAFWRFQNINNWFTAASCWFQNQAIKPQGGSGGPSQQWNCPRKSHLWRPHGSQPDQHLGDIVKEIQQVAMKILKTLNDWKIDDPSLCFDMFSNQAIKTTGGLWGPIPTMELSKEIASLATSRVPTRSTFGWNREGNSAGCNENSQNFKWLKNWWPLFVFRYVFKPSH